MKALNTTWDVWTYDVWGNADDGYEVNDRYCIARDVEIDCPIKAYNIGTPHEFRCAELPESVILNWLGSESNGQGDDTHIYVDDEDGKPIGEMICTSHDSLTIK